MVYAHGKHAFGFCDRCGWRWPLKDLKTEYETGVSRNNRVCPTCWDPDHPQNFLHLVKTDDRISLRDPRPDQAEQASRRIDVTIYVGTGVLAQGATGEVGEVEVTTT